MRFIAPTKLMLHKTQYAIRNTHDAKGVALIIVIFAMMLFAVLGWTLANLQSGDFEINLRNLDSERALGLAEAGAQWALNQLSQNASWRTSADTICNVTVGSDWSAQNLNASTGQYNIYVCCRPPQATESGDAVIESIGYAPYQSSYRAMRQVKVAVSLGGLTNAVMTQPADPDVANKGLLNWWPARQNHTIQIEGNVYTGHYDGDGDAAYDEAGQDYDDQPAPILPQDSESPSDERRNFTASYPSIDMAWFYNNTAAGNRWPSPSNRDIEAAALATSSGSTLNVDQGGFFNGMQNMAVRNSGPGHGTWNDGDWAVINTVPGGYNYTRATLDRTIGDDWDNDTVKLVRRVYNNVFNDGLRYTGGLASGEAGALSADLLIDLRSTDVELRNTYHICEGDIVVKGTNELTIRFTGTGTRYPTLATQNGDIISIEPLEALVLSESQRQNLRQIDGLVYSEFGHVNLNYIRPPVTSSPSFRGNLVYGYRITLDGATTVTYVPAVLSSSGGFIFASSELNWQEQ